MAPKSDLASLADEILELESETFEISDYSDASEVVLAGSTSCCAPLDLLHDQHHLLQRLSPLRACGAGQPVPHTSHPATALARQPTLPGEGFSGTSGLPGALPPDGARHGNGCGTRRISSSARSVSRHLARRSAVRNRGIRRARCRDQPKSMGSRPGTIVQTVRRPMRSCSGRRLVDDDHVVPRPHQFVPAVQAGRPAGPRCAAAPRPRSQSAVQLLDRPQPAAGSRYVPCVLGHPAAVRRAGRGPSDAAPWRSRPPSPPVRRGAPRPAAGRCGM